MMTIAILHLLQALGQNSPSEEQFVYTFNSNGTGFWEVYNGTTLNNSELFTYKVNGNILEMAAGSATGTMTIKELTDKV